MGGQGVESLRGRGGGFGVLPTPPPPTKSAPDYDVTIFFETIIIIIIEYNRL